LAGIATSTKPALSSGEPAHFGERDSSRHIVGCIHTDGLACESFTSHIVAVMAAAPQGTRARL
jgi:hypothetical protein